MQHTVRRWLPAGVVGVTLALVMAGITTGAAGDNMIVGASNNSGSSQTILLTTAGGASFTLKNTTAGQTGQFGWSSGTTGAGRGIYGRADSPNGFGVDAYNSGTVSGSGAAIRARADKNDAIDATASGCQTGFICGSFGVHGTGYGFGAGVFGDGTGSLAGIEASAGTAWAFYGTSNVADFVGGLMTNTAGTGFEGDGVGATTSPACDPNYCAGLVGTGDNGVMGISNTFVGYGVYGRSDNGVAVYADGAAVVSGDLTVNGTCTGCAGALLASNGGTTTIHQGQAVTLKGVTTGPNGQTVVVVTLAKGNDPVLGIADVALAPAGNTTSVAASTKTLKTKFGDVVRRSAARTLKVQGNGTLLAKGTSIAAGAYLRVVTSGVFTYAGTAPNASVGDSLAVGATAGKLAKAGSSVAKGATAGKYLGKLKDGRIALLVSPS